jgi:hypothetical protein
MHEVALDHYCRIPRAVQGVATAQMRKAPFGILGPLLLNLPVALRHRFRVSSVIAPILVQTSCPISKAFSTGG